MADFPKSRIEVRHYSDNWGPFTFDFDDAIPTSDTVASALVSAYEGNVTAKDDLDDETEVTGLIDTGDQAPSCSDTTVSVYFVHPGAAYVGAEKRATLVFKLTLTSGAKHTFFFQYVYIK